MTDKQKALAVGGGGLGLLFVIRQRQKKAQQQKGGLTSLAGAGGSVTPFTPAQPVILQPGETVYDPNSGGLYNTPTAPTAGTDPQPDPNNPPPPAPQPTTPSGPGYVININYPPRVGTKIKRTKPIKRAHGGKHPKPHHPKPKHPRHPRTKGH